MGNQSYLESLFANSRCDSQFAYFCFFVLLMFLFYTFAEGVLEKLKDEQEKKNIEIQKANLKSNNNTIPTSPSLLTNIGNISTITDKATAQKDYTDL